MHQQLIEMEVKLRDLQALGKKKKKTACHRIKAVPWNHCSRILSESKPGLWYPQLAKLSTRHGESAKNVFITLHSTGNELLRLLQNQPVIGESQKSDTGAGIHNAAFCSGAEPQGEQLGPTMSNRKSVRLHCGV